MARTSSGIVVTVSKSLGLSDAQISALQSAFAAQLVQVLQSAEAAQGPSTEPRPQVSQPDQPSSNRGANGTPHKQGLTPGGYRTPDAIHRVESGERVHRTLRGHEIRDKATGHVVREVLRRRLPPAKPGTKAAAAPAPGAAADGWQAYVGWTNDTGTPISLLQATWIVPPPPADVADQTIFLFPGVENIAGDVGILQPVLQWGVSHIGGGPYWTVASWYVASTGDAFYSNELVNVDPGQELTGTISLVPAGPDGPTLAQGTYYYDCVFTGVGGTDLATGDLPELTWANLTLEAYSVANQSQYPCTDATTYAAINLVAAPGLAYIPWVPIILTGDFGESANPMIDAVPGGQVAIVY
jgi:hypothetical protein